ncbi:MAG: hypothetical protein NC394_08480 [Bacteroides sp.]|nr:hypothetical protein [Bacteroides sp.]
MNENEKNEAAVVQETIGTNDPAPAQEKPSERTFTQAELDAAVAKERQSRPSDDELKAFSEWKESQKTEQEKTAEKIKLAQEAQTAAEQKALALEAKFTAVSKGVKPEAVEDVIALAKNKVSDTVTLEKAIESVIEKYPQFGAAAEKPSTTGVATPNNGGPADDTLMRKAMGLPVENENKKKG